MELVKYLKTATNLNKYISLTLDIQNKRIDLKVPFNISTILYLKDIRSIEIEYFNKCEENGAATKIFEFLLRSPPSKTWSLLGRELISLLQYWLEAIRKHLIIHNIHWWTFLNLILNFIKDVSLKDVSLNKILIEETAECLLDLATHSIPNAKQRNEIIQTFNAISAEASRPIRLAYKEKFQEYFNKLSALLPTAGDIPLQFHILEALLRWLLPRHKLAVRRSAADKWFPQGIYSRRAVDIFLQRPWQDFIKDARDFLNAQNESSEHVTSVICKSFSVGKRVCLSVKNECWLDVNLLTKRLSILLHPKWDALGGDGRSDALLICDENTAHVELRQEFHEVLITATVLELSRVYPFSCDVVAVTASPYEVHMSVSTKSDISRLDESLRCVFGEKYKMSLDIKNVALCMSPADKQPTSDVINGTDEDMRFSMPPRVTRGKHSGYIARPRNPGSWNSPSTVSTSSLAQLHEKLAALPRYTFEKEPVTICALPQLSTVSEVSEAEEHHTINSSLSTIKYRRYGISQKSSCKTESKISHSTSNDSNEKRNLSPALNDDENSISCLLLATIGSAEDSIVSDAIGRLPKNIPCNTDNIVDLLAQEALESNGNRHNTDINSEANKDSSDIQQKDLLLIVNNLSESNNVNQTLQQNPISIDQQFIDESSNEIVENTPFSWVQVKRPKYKKAKNTSKPNASITKESESAKLVHNVETVESFFSQHVTQNRNGELVISPSLARKINETSSECSDDFDQCIFRDDPSYKYIVQDIVINQIFTPDRDIIECMNAMVDKVCEDLDKCVQHMDLVDNVRKDENKCRSKRTLTKTTYKKPIEGHDTHGFKNNVPNSKGKPNRSVKLKIPIVKCKKTSKNTIKPKKEQPFTVMSPIIERESIVDDTITKNVDSFVESPKSSVTKPLLRRKRKLYSPKDETCHQKTNVHTSEIINKDGTMNLRTKVNSETPTTIATSYKELEQERKKQIRKPRNRLSLKKVELSISPRTLKRNQIFDSLKEIIDGEPVKLADKAQLKNSIAVYNYTSESEDEDEKKTKTQLVLKTSSPPTNRGNIEIISGSSKQTNKSVKTTEEHNIRGKRPPKLRTKRTLTKPNKEDLPKISNLPYRNLEDERMRTEAPEVLNTSLVNEYPKGLEKSTDKYPEPALNVPPQMECIIEDNKSEDQATKENHHKSKNKRSLSLKRNKVIPKVNPDLSMADNEGTISPLPGLVVETILTTEMDVNDSVSANMLQKFKDIYQGRPVTVSEVNTTQNLLSDIEQINYSPSNFNVTEELNKVDNKNVNELNKNKNKKKNTVKKNVKQKKTRKMKVECPSLLNAEVNEKSGVIELSVTEVNSERSMATMGNSHSPITAHGDFEENPPNSALLNEHIEPRIVREEFLNKSIKDFFSKLTDQLNDSCTADGVEAIDCFKEDSKISGRSSIKSDSVSSPVVVMTRLSPEYIRSRVSVNSSLVDSNNSQINLNVSSRPRTCKDNFVNKKDDSNNNEEFDKASSKAKGNQRKSTISPINLYDDFKFKTISPRSESEDNCVKRIKNIFTNKNHATTHSNSTLIEINKTHISRRTSQNNICVSSPISSGQSIEDGKRETIASKRKSSPILRPSKRSKYGEEINNFGSTITESGPSLSSVNEWFKRTEPTYTGDNINLSIQENLNNVLEKLDTTLVEIHHNTSKRFINMFVEATTQLSSLKEKREQLQRQAAVDIMSGVVKIVDEKFIELNNRFQAMDDQFMEYLKKQAHDLVREECKQKRAMVTLLKEDTQAVLDHLEKARGPR